MPPVPKAGLYAAMPARGCRPGGQAQVPGRPPEAGQLSELEPDTSITCRWPVAR